MRNGRRFVLGATLLALLLTLGACKSGGGETKGGGGKTIASTFVFGAPPDCPTNQFCQLGLKRVYGIVFKQVKPLDFGGPLTVKALKSGAIQVGELFSTSVYDPDFVVLEDDKHLQAADNLVPVVRKQVDSSDIDTLLNGIMAKLTTENVLAMNKQYDLEHKDAADIAQAFVQQNGLLGAKSTSGAGKTITVGVSANFNEQVILAEMYRMVLENAGYTVKTETNIESRKVSDPALFSGKIDLKTEYLASEARALDEKANLTGDPDNNAQVLKDLYAAKGVNVLDFSPAADQNVFVVTKATASKYSLSKVSDLAKTA
ncbi:MAG TPA: glycine betaine ABC transporter substrate-binding protein [Actinomycetota bacterium]